MRKRSQQQVKQGIKTVLRCESCKGFHPEDEMNEVIVKVVVGKNCKLDQATFLNNIAARPTEAVPTPTPTELINTTPQVSDEEAALAARAEARKRRSIVPPGLRKAMIPPPELMPPA